MTVAMLKDSSLVSVIAVTELEKQTQIFATDMRSWIIPGLLCAGLRLSMSLPVAHLARRSGEMEVGDAMSVVLVIHELRPSGRGEISYAGLSPVAANSWPDGPVRAGKSTVLRAVAGLEPSTPAPAGRRRDRGAVRPTSPSMLAPLRRKIGMKFRSMRCSST
jgi:hypothetical protein